jgi:hypothetical protein
MGLSSRSSIASDDDDDSVDFDSIPNDDDEDVVAIAGPFVLEFESVDEDGSDAFGGGRCIAGRGAPLDIGVLVIV